MRYRTQSVVTCYYHYLHITFIITKVLKLLNKFTYKHTIIFMPEGVKHLIFYLSLLSLLVWKQTHRWFLHIVYQILSTYF